MRRGAGADRVAILLDGEYVKRVLRQRLTRFPSQADVIGEVRRIQRNSALDAFSLYRVFYYTAEPLSGTAIHPLTGNRIDFGNTTVFSRNTQLIDLIENEPDVAVRRGALVHQGWQIGPAAVRALTQGDTKTVGSGDVIPKILQKGVDMRIGLDLAWLALKRLVGAVVLVSGDSDLVPALKLARREGLRVYLDALGNRRIRQELKKHADLVL
ncbi:MAG: NYN domain-containing protein [Gemmatimonadota bacterium]|nr:MAG: NYN domain-containing protein [Gemmatimonadota bacterium]